MSLNFYLYQALVIFLGVSITGAVISAEVGSLHPECQLQTNEGNQVNLTELNDNRVLFVDFWASWCPPCAKSFPFMNQLMSEYNDQGFSVIAVNMDENRADAEGFLSRMPVNFTIVYDNNGQCAEAFNVQAMPSSYVIDRTGMIRQVNLGFRSGEAEAIEEQVRSLTLENAKSNVPDAVSPALHQH